MKNKKGFTLIELLAVIVILAIIALIAVPVILNIIDKANKSAFKDTAYGIISAGELHFAEQQLELNGMEADATFTFPTNEIDIKGNVPDGTVLKVNTKGETALSMSNGRYCVTKGYEDTDITVTDNIENCDIPETVYTNGIMTSTNKCIQSGVVCSESEIKSDEGVLVNVQVNDNETKNFYVIADDGKKLTLIMDRNLGNSIGWYAGPAEDRVNIGPTTALNYLNELTDDEWDNVPAITGYEYKNNPDASGAIEEYGYQKLVITNGVGVLTSKDGNTTTTLSGTSRARLLTDEEATPLIITENVDDMPGRTTTRFPAWVGGEAGERFWLLSSATSDGIDYATYINGQIGGGWITPYNSSWCNTGIRPVIELSK